jgi:hypothetical protein
MRGNRFLRAHNRGPLQDKRRDRRGRPAYTRFRLRHGSEHAATARERPIRKTLRNPSAAGRESIGLSRKTSSIRSAVTAITLTPMRSATTFGLSVLFLLTGCSKAYYGMWEKFGYEKRDLLVSEVEDAKKSQEQAKEQFKTTLERFQALTNFQGGELESKYKKLNSEYERSKSRAEAVTKQISDVDEVATAMFKEWKQELDQYQNANLRSQSEQKLNESKERYGELISAMRKAEGKMQPVLKAFGDQVLFLKHNLNAQAIASLQTTTAQIDSDVQALIKDMEASINEANEFISQMKT